MRGELSEVRGEGIPAVEHLHPGHGVVIRLVLGWQGYRCWQVVAGDRWQVMEVDRWRLMSGDIKYLQLM